MHNASKTTTKQSGIPMPLIAPTATVTRRKIKNYVYHLDIITFKNGNVEFDYSINNNWFSASINFAKLATFADEYFELNTGDNQRQTSAAYDIAAYVIEFIDEVSLAYLKATKAGQNVN